MKANEFVEKFGWDNTEIFLNKSLPVQQKYFRKLKTPCGELVDAKELMNELLLHKIKAKINQIGFENLKDFLNTLEVDIDAFGGCIVDNCYSLRIKRLVESHEVVERCGGIDAAKEKLKYFINWLAEDWTHAEFAPEIGKFKQAIADVESCQ